MIPRKSDADVAAARLDAFQRRFVEAEDTNVRLLAPAGSGKTHSLLWRCAEILHRSEGQARFLIVTFTRAARDELRARLFTPQFGSLSTNADVVTLNGWGHRIIRGNFLNPRLMTSENDRNLLIRNTLQASWAEEPAIAEAMRDHPYQLPKILAEVLDILKALGFDHEDGSMRHANARLDALEDLGLSRHIDQLIEKLQEHGVLANRRLETFVETVMPFWVKACDLQVAQSTFTLEDQKYVAFLDTRRRVREGSRPTADARTTHILVDEFQDINPLDLALVREIAVLNDAKITIVGDDDQAIFEWRGATPDYILEPQAHFGQPFATHILERNYRCPRNLVEKSARLIEHNQHREAKTMSPVLERDAEIERLEHASFVAATDAVMKEVRAFLARDVPGEKLAVLSRKRAQLIPYQIIMAREGLSFCAAEDLHVFLSETFDRLLHAIRTRAMATLGVRLPTMVEDVVTLCNSVRRFPLKRAEADALARHLRNGRPKSYDEVIDALEAYRGPLKGKNEDGKISAAFAQALRKLVHAPTVRAAIEAMQDLFGGFQQDYGRAQEDIFLVDPPFLYLTEFAEAYGDDFQRFLDDLETAKDTLVRLPGEDKEDDANSLWRRPVHLMTALRAKGKEFDTVVMLDVVDGIWPLRRAKSEREIEAERRLFYVAMTRAKRRLILTLSGRIGDQVASASPFLEEAKLT
ncbi:UvrD-helicase domain-containing protein [Consotaella salsifontis]|uniref:DNA 3'-5' helicase n=1 Tax=Consotaella salsifontis TaxID=1365950 RepID=A0A1T4S247_9HYPH|nr:ATP-dependent helicase [Consotaella salsifontis]SKA22314.1 DNA helicase-2 / ATP-dependent DNA helicase PcrA [Consotaella salsifontis]